MSCAVVVAGLLYADAWQKKQWKVPILNEYLIFLIELLESCISTSRI